MPICSQKGQKDAEVGGADGQNQLFCILLKIGSLDFFDILHKGYKLPQMSFSEKFSFSQKRAQKRAKIGFLDFCGKLSH